MPENKTIHDLPIAEQTSSSDVFETEIPSQLMQSGYASRKVTISSLENHMLGTEQYETQLPNFPQGSRSVFSALEYARQSGGGGASANEALPYDENSSYEYGDYCIQNNYLWRCTSTTGATGTWDATKWVAVMVTDEYKRVRIMTKAQFDLLSNDEKDGFIYVPDYPTKIQDIDNVTLTTSDNNKLLGVSVSGSDISVGAVKLTAADIPYTSGVSVKDILDIQTNDTILSASWIAQSQTAGDTPLTNYLSLTKGFYLVIVAYPILDVTDSLLSDIVGSNISKWGGSYIQLSSQQNSVRLIRANADTQIRVNSMQSKTVNFSYLDRGGLFAYRLA